MEIRRQHFKSIDSTHAQLMRAGDELAEGTLITADFQEKGRGRLGRTWTASPGSSLLASLLLKPKIAAAKAPQLTHAIALACAHALIREGLDIKIRWPNDLVCNDKKIAGILAESSILGNKVDFAVLSFGINLNQSQGELDEIDRPATSCAVESGKAWDPDKLLDAIMAELKALYSSYVTEGFAALKKGWESLNYLEGRAITIDLGNSKMDGIAKGIDDDGRLILSVKDETKKFTAGEVIRVSGETL